mmetsp:Transcript_1963/g.3437  ORF Transcript_1963/g.3437 Transcript_1963/m.3437 type:complete len:108 (+) Transcript_1963:133-456(+)
MLDGREIELDFFIDEINDSENKMKMDLKKKKFSQFKQSQGILISKFLKFVVLKVSQKKCHINIRRAKIDKNKFTSLFVSIKDPFIPGLNHGSAMVEKDNFRKMIKEF